MIFGDLTNVSRETFLENAYSLFCSMQRSIAANKIGLKLLSDTKMGKYLAQQGVSTEFTGNR